MFIVVEELFVHESWNQHEASFVGDLALLKIESEFIGSNIGIQIKCENTMPGDELKELVFSKNGQNFYSSSLRETCYSYNDDLCLQNYFCMNGRGECVYSSNEDGFDQLEGVVSREIKIFNCPNYRKFLVTDIRKHTKWIKDIVCKNDDQLVSLIELLLCLDD